MSLPNWLPSLITLAQSNGDWELYLNKIYEHFLDDFIRQTCSFRGIKIAIKRHPQIDHKEITFWHIISDGEDESKRLPNLRRCERIGWPRPIITRVPNSEIKMWENKRGTEKRICLWVEKAEYLVVLAVRNNYLLLWTAYPVTQAHSKKKLEKEYLSSLKS